MSTTPAPLTADRSARTPPWRRGAVPHSMAAQLAPIPARRRRRCQMVLDADPTLHPGTLLECRDHEAAVAFLGLSGVVEFRDGDVVFPLGVLYPYTADLRRACAAIDAVRSGVPESPAALLSSIEALHGRIAFAGPVARPVAAAYCAVERAVRSDPGSSGRVLFGDTARKHARRAAQVGAEV